MIWRSGIDGSCDYFNEPWLTFTGRTLDGLGLFIAKAIAHARGGALEIESADGATTARLLLPRHTSGPVAQ